MKNLLVVDFDFFFPNPMEADNPDDAHWGLYDWGHRETPFFLSNLIWSTRAAGFFQNNLPLPTIRPPAGGWETFWNRFTFADDARFAYADSNMHAGELTPADGSPAYNKVVLFDAHHDSGYNLTHIHDFITKGSYSCEDWMLVHQLRGTRDLTVRYPQWKPNGLNEHLADGVLTTQIIDDTTPLDDVIFDDVFVCRSGAWVPAWCDADFLTFIDTTPLGGIQIDDEELDRQFDPEEARQQADFLRSAMASVTPSLNT